MIRIFTDANYLKPEYRSAIFPLLLHLHFKENKELLGLYAFVNTIEEADIAIVPVYIEWLITKGKKAEMDAFINRALAAGKKVWLYTSGDLGLTVRKNVYTFRLGGFHSKMDTQTIILPSFTEDPYIITGFPFKVWPKTATPLISFTGNADESLTKWVKEFYVYMYYNVKRWTGQIPSDYQAFYPSGIKRVRILKKLQASDRIKTDFIFRKSYRAGAKTDEKRKATQLEFFENMYQSPFVFCMRGTGNFSVRFYEALAMGRIPVVVDTDFRLPIPELIDWTKHCVIVSEENIIEDFCRFYDKMDEKNFLEMQEGNRALWLEKLNGPSFFAAVHEMFAP